MSHMTKGADISFESCVMEHVVNSSENSEQNSYGRCIIMTGVRLKLFHGEAHVTLMD